VRKAPEADNLLDLQRHIRGERLGEVGDHLGPLPVLFVQAFPIELYPTRRACPAEGFRSDKGSEEGGLSGPIWTEQPHKLSALDVQADIFEAWARLWIGEGQTFDGEGSVQGVDLVLDEALELL
jgi:hypothetical protein